MIVFNQTGELHLSPTILLSYHLVYSVTLILKTFFANNMVIHILTFDVNT